MGRATLIYPLIIWGKLFDRPLQHLLFDLKATLVLAEEGKALFSFVIFFGVLLTWTPLMVGPGSLAGTFEPVSCFSFKTLDSWNEFSF